MANIPVSSAINTLLTSTTLNASTAALGALGAPVTGAAIASELNGETLVLDGFTVTDFAGLTIPSNTYGQKNGVPFFGNTSLADSINSKILVNVQSIVAGTGITSINIGSIPVSASDAVDGKFFNIVANLNFDGTGGGATFSGNDKLYFVARFGLAAPVFTSGAWMEITPVNLVEAQIFQVELLIQASVIPPYNIKPNFNTTATIQSSSAVDGTTNASVKLAKSLTFNNPLLFNTTNGAATTIGLYLAVKADSGNFSIYDIKGSVEIVRGTPITGSLA